MTDATTSIPLYWWRDEPNFGDSLSPWLIEQLLGFSVQWSKSGHKLVGLGSVLWASEAGDTVWGTGVHPLSELRAPDWSPIGVTFLAVRGPLTRAYILERGGECPELYGDPGELLPYYYVPRSDVAHRDLGIIPHIYDNTGRQFAKSVPGARIIDPGRPWQNVVDEIAACRLIWSSSLHGLIVAEAFRIPAIWVACSEGAIKYQDYYYSTGRTEVHPVAWVAAAEASPPALPECRPLESHPLVHSILDWWHGKP
ncbi:MAG: polysaccharide pyruvyl transferase family protein [Planctomycetaceae bacterium]|nr:polysaccharide pyruvyl transferase family protein [Planctomycetaceae bacterium]